MSELRQDKGQSGGSGRTLPIQGDLNSALVRELIAQLNQQEIPVVKTLELAGNGTARGVLGSWRYNAWIKEIRLLNEGAAALANAATDLMLKTCAHDDVNMAAGPAAPADVLLVEGFGVGNMPAKTALWGDQFLAGTNCDAVTDKRKGFIVKAGEVLYAEVINTEGAAIRVGVEVVLVNTDRIEVSPDNLQLNVPHPNQRFHPKTRGEV